MIKLNVIFGDPVAQSLSPNLHNFLYQSLGLDYVFSAHKISNNDLPSTISSIRNLQINGAAITIPHKVAILQFLDKINPVAQKIGAVNTIKNLDGKLVGYNTDWWGIYEPLKNTIKDHKTVAILGGGGACRAVLYACQKLGLVATVFARDISKIKDLEVDFDCQIKNWTDFIPNYGIIINTTPVGMYPNTDDCPLNQAQLQKLHSGQIIYDTVYNPKETMLIKAGLKLGATCILGQEMFIYQAIKQFEIHTDIVVNYDLVRNYFNN